MGTRDARPREPPEAETERLRVELRTELRAVGVRWWWTGDSTLTAMPDTVRATAKNWHRPLTADQRVKLEQMGVSVPEVPLSPREAHETGLKTAPAIPADLIDLALEGLERGDPIGFLSRSAFGNEFWLMLLSFNVETFKRRGIYEKALLEALIS